MTVTLQQKFLLIASLTTMRAENFAKIIDTFPRRLIVKLIPINSRHSTGTATSFHQFS